MILDDKVIMTYPPPPYVQNATTPTPNGIIVLQHPHPQTPRTANSHAHPPPPFSEVLHSPAQSYPRLSSLPPHILLQIVWNTFPTHPSLDTGLHEYERQTFLWLAKSLRLVNRSFYIACMHVLRSTYHTAYTSLVRPFYSTDPFPSHASIQQGGNSKLNTVQRETPVLDMYIALKVREDVCVDDSELHLEREDMFKDIFDHAQPKARLEDLIREYGIKEGLVTLSPPGVVVYTSTGGGSTSSASEDDDGTVVGADDRKPLPLSSPSPAPTASSRLKLQAQPQQKPRSTTSRFFSAFRRHKTPSPPATIVAFNQNSRTASPPREPQRRIQAIPFSLLSISYGTRKVGLQLMSVQTGAKRTIVEVQRMSREESLEVTARRVVVQLKALLLDE